MHVELNAPPVVATVSDAMTAARTLADELRIGAVHRDQTGGLPYEATAALARSGLLSIVVPVAHGGPPLPASTVVDVHRVLAAADPSITQILQNHFTPLALLDAFGVPGGPLEFLFREALEGAQFATAAAERAGADAHAVATRFTRRTPTSWQIRGTKFYCTGAFSARWLLVMGTDDDGAPISAFVPRDDPGIEIVDDWRAVGQRATGSGTTVLHDVIVADEFVFRHPRSSDRPLLYVPLGQCLHAAIDVGIGRGAFEEARAFIRESARRWVDAKVDGAREDPQIVTRVGQLGSLLHAAEALLARAGAAIERAADDLTTRTCDEARIAVSEAKVVAADVTLQICTELFAFGGSRAAFAEHDLDRHWRNARTHTVHSPMAWQQFHIGNWELNGVAPPNNGYV